MDTHRFGMKIKLASTIAIKHQLRKMMFDDLVKQAENAEKAEKAEEKAEKAAVIARTEQLAILNETSPH